MSDIQGRNWRRYGAGRCTIVANSSLRKRMRAARRGIITPLVPSEQELMRHKWYQKKKYWDKMRALYGELST